MFKLDLEKAEEPEINCQHPLDHQKSKRVQKNIYFCFTDSIRPPYLPLRNLYAGQEATVRTGHGIMDWFQIGKGAHQGCILSPCLFNLYAEYIRRNTGLDESQAGIKIP